MIIELSKSNRKDKKWKAVLYENGEKKKTIHFGAKGMSDYTIHKDKKRMERYINRHKKQEEKFWNKKNVMTPSWMSRFILWSKPSLNEAIRYVNNRFNLNIRIKRKH